MSLKQNGPGNERDPDDAVTAFERMAAGYDLWYRTPLGALVDALEKEAIFSLAEVRAGETALDVGCGTGNYTLELARRGVMATGIDPSTCMLDVGRRKAAEHNLTAKFICGFAEELPFPEDTFDLVTCVTALEFTSSPKRAVAEMVRTLKPGGRLVVGVLSSWSLWAMARRLEQRSTVYAHAHFFNPFELTSLLRPYGPVVWWTAIFFPRSCVRPSRSLAEAVEFLGKLLLRPFGAFIAARVAKRR